MLSINFVTQKSKWERIHIIRACIFDESFLPPGEVFESLFVSDVVGEDAAVGSSVEGVAQGLELLLPRCIPNLQSHQLIVYHHFLLRKICSNSWLRIPCYSSVQELLQECSLSNSRITENYDLKETLLFRRHLYYLISNILNYNF